MRCGLFGCCQMRCVAVTSPEPPTFTASALPLKPPMLTTMPSLSTGEVYTSGFSPSHVHTSLPVFASISHTRNGHDISSLPPAIGTGSLHEP